MTRKIAWLLEAGDDECHLPEIYREAFPSVEIDFYRSPGELLPHLGKRYDAFVIGLFCNPEPYSIDETKQGNATGLRLLDDIRSNSLTRDTPVLVVSTLADFYAHEIRERDAKFFRKGFTPRELQNAVKSLIPSA